jgi:hypothetical protein
MAATIHPQIVWSANSRHFIIENKLKYILPVYLGLRLRRHIKQSAKPCANNLVNEWYNTLDSYEQLEIEITQLN